MPSRTNPETRFAPAEYTGASNAAPETERLDVKVVVQPPEVFEDNTGKVLKVASTNNYSVVYRASNTGHEYVIYDESGKKVKGTDKIPALVIDGPKLGSILARTGSGMRIIDSGDYYGYTKPKDLLVSLNLPSSLEQELSAKLKTLFPQNNVLYDSHLRETRQVIISPESEIMSTGDKSRIVFRVDKTLYAYQTVNDQGRVLNPSEWLLTKVPDNSKIDADELKQSPYLREFMETQKGRPLEGLNVAIDNERGILNVIDTEKNIRIFSDASAGYAVDPNDKKTIYYLDPSNRELKSFQADQASLTQTQVETRQLPFQGTVLDLKFDPQGNFFLINVDEGGNRRLLIIEKDTLTTAAAIDGVEGHVDVDNLGNIYFVDKQKQLRLANTNFMTFPKGGLEQARKERRERLIKLRERFANIDLNAAGHGQTQTLSPDQMSEEQIIRTLGQQLRERFEPELAKANTIEDLDRLAINLEALKTDPELSPHPEIFLGLEDQIQKKINGLKADDFSRQIEEFKNLLEATGNARQALELDAKFTTLMQSRRGVLLTDPAQRKVIDIQLRALEAQKQQKIDQYANEIITALGERWQEVEQLIQDTGTAQELTALSTDAAVIEFEGLVAQIKDRKVSQGWRQKYREALKKRKLALENEVKASEEEERSRLAQILEESREIYEEIEQALEKEISDAKELTNWRRGNPLLSKFRAKIISLPDALRESEEKRLELLLRQKQRDTEHREVLNIPKKGGEVNFGHETFPIFEDVQVVWQPKVVPLSEGSAYGNLVFQDSLGRIYAPKMGSVPVDLKDPLTQETIALNRGAAEKYFESLKRKVPEFNDKWVLNTYNRDILSNIAKLSKIQVNEHRGILILEGEAGTGKNVLVDMFAHFTNRETFTFSCNFQSEKEDITYAFKFDPQRGTYQIDSRFIEMLQTPGATIVLDEINTLPPGVAKMLNPLLDYRRTIYLPDGRAIKADETVLIVATMNPQHYLGVKPLSQEVKSRARILYVDYPPEKKAGRETPYEAEILAKYTDDLAGVNQEEFEKLWDFVINNDRANGGDKFATKEREAALQKIHQIIKTANKIREAYQAFRTRKSNDVVEFVFSLRESVDIAAELNHVKDVKQAIKDVVLPKISEPDEKERVRTIIDNV